MLTPRRSRPSSSRRGGYHPRHQLSTLPPCVPDGVVASEISALTVFSGVESSLAQLKTNVYETIYSHYKHFYNANQYNLDLRDDIGSLEERLAALTELEDFAEVADKLSRDIAYVRSKMVGMRTTLSILDTVTKLHQHIQEFDNLMETGDFTVAASSTEEMNDLLVNINSHQDVCDSEVLAILTAQYIKKRAALKHRLQELTASAIKFTVAGNVQEMTVVFTITATPFKTYFRNPVMLEDIFTAFNTLGELEEKLKLVARQAVDHLLLSLVQRGDLAQIATSRTKLHAKCTVTVASRSGFPSQQSHEADHAIGEEEAFRRALELSKFLCASMFDPGGGKVTEGRNDIVATFGRAWWPAVWNVLKTEVLDRDGHPTRPRPSPDATGKLLAVGREFEREMHLIGIMPSGSNEVSLFLDSRAARFTKRRRAELLATARDILTSEDRNTVEVTDATERGGLSIVSEEKGGVGMESLSSGKSGKPGVEGKEGVETVTAEDGIQLPTCHITVQTQTLVEMAYQTLMEISRTDGQDAIELFYCARDLFDLFRAVVPSHRAEELENSLTRSVLLHNDCAYIVHHLLTIGYQFKPRLPPPLQQTATMVDMIPAFRKLGQGYFRAQMRRQRDLLLEALRSAEGFGDTDCDERFDNVEKAIKRCTYQLTQVSNKWKVILPTKLYLKSLGILLGTAVETMIGEVLKLERIRAEETHQLRYVLGMFPKGAATGAWFCITRLDPGIGGIAAAKRRTVEKFPIAKYCSAWSKFETFSQLLEADAGEFAERRSAGTLKEYFADSELDRLYSALHGKEPEMRISR